MKNELIRRLTFIYCVMLLSGFNTVYAERTVTGLNETISSASSQGLSFNYFTRKTINGAVKRQDGTPVETTFYVQDISSHLPELVGTHKSGVDGRYSFELGVGQWRVIPVSTNFQFEPRTREYDTRLNRMAQ